MATSPKPLSSSAVPWEESNDIPRFGTRYRPLSFAIAGEAHRVGVAIEELATGYRSNPSHYHFLEEEHVYVLDGAMTLRLGEAALPMKAGDYVCFPAGQRVGHHFVNDGDAPCSFVIIGERNPNEVVVYPDSNKVLVRSLGRRAIFDMAAIRGYWDGEDTGLSAQALPPAVGAAPAPAGPPKPPVAADAIEWDIEGTGPRFGGRSKHLTHAAVGPNYHVGVLIESPAPGMRLAPKHYHMLEEEHALILDGEVTLLLGDERIALNPGDYVLFPAGQKVGHSFLNSGSGPCSYLMIGERNPADVCVYADSNKVQVRALNSRDDIFDMAAVRRYFDGEDTGD